MFRINDLHASVHDSPVLKGVNLTVNPGEVHAIMGPNGSGKSTLASVLAGKDAYEVTSGEVTLLGQDLLALSPEERAALGLFLGFQYPIEIPGVNNMYFMKAAVNSIRKQKKLDEYDAVDFLDLVHEKMQLVDMSDQFLQRSVNTGFSGGEKKRNEILQMLLLEPTLAVLDETDSGLDIDALQSVAKGVNAMRDSNRSFILVTHYQRLLDHIEPDFVHVFMNGKIVKSGDKTLAHELEANGYGWIHG